MAAMNLESLKSSAACADWALPCWCCCCCILAWALVPPLPRHLIESRGSEALGRRLSVAEVDFRPWSLELTLHDLCCTPPTVRASSWRWAASI
jgi:hypothetical protein